MNLYKLLKQNAPKFFKEVVFKKIVKLENEIRRLREEYRQEKDEKKKEEIKNRGLGLKKELEEIRSLLNENEIPADNNKKNNNLFPL